MNPAVLHDIEPDQVRADGDAVRGAAGDVGLYRRARAGGGQLNLGTDGLFGDVGRCWTGERRRRDWTRERQRVEKLFEDAQIKLSSVISDLFGVSGRAMLDRCPALGNRVMSTPSSAISSAAVKRPTYGIVVSVAPPVGRKGRQLLDVLLQTADLGGERVDLVSWAKFYPTTHESAGKTKPKSRTKGNPWLGASIGNTVGALTRTPTFLGARYRRVARRRGKGKAMAAAGNSLLTSVYHLLADSAATYHDLGPTYHHTLVNQDRRARHLAAALEAVTGQNILIRDGKDHILDTEPAA